MATTLRTSGPGRRIFRTVAVSTAIFSLAMLIPSSRPSQRADAVTPSRTVPVSTNVLYVSASGQRDGTGTRTAPLTTIQAALDRAEPGTTIRLAAGVYAQGGVTRRDGTSAQPIVIVGPAIVADPTATDAAAPPTATVFGGVRVLTIANSHYTIEGFSIDGQRALEARTPADEWPTAGAETELRFKAASADLVVNNRLIYIDGGPGRPGVVGTVIYRMTLTGAGGECIRVRSDASDTEIAKTRIRWCGMFPVLLAGVNIFHNGEGVYIGTSPKSTTLPGYLNDQTSDTLVTHDLIQTYGTECMDVKENSYDNVLSTSVCEGNTEPGSEYGSNVELRGYRNLVVGNTIQDSTGFGVKIDTDTPSEDLGQNSIKYNTMSHQTSGPFYVKSLAKQLAICGNITPYVLTSAFFKPCPA